MWIWKISRTSWKTLIWRPPSGYLLITWMEPIELLETWLIFVCLFKMKGCIQVWSLLGGLLSLQSCQDICAWACVGDPNLQFGEACENPEFWYNLLTDPMSSIMKWVTYRRVEGWFIVSQWVKTEKKETINTCTTELSVLNSIITSSGNWGL